MSIINLFDIASSGVTAQRQAMEVAGENIANVNTPGYSRQQVIMANRPVTTSNGFALGTGVEIQAVRRSYDGMLQQQIVDGNSTYQQSLARQTALEQIQPSFNEVASDGLGKALDNFFGAWQDLSTNPQGTPERQALLSRSQILVDTFNQMSKSLTSVANSADKNLGGIAAEVTGNARDLGLVNIQILATQAVGGNPNELLDQRDLLLQKISEKVGITTKLESDGTATVKLAGGETLVSGGKYATLYASQNDATTNNSDILLSGLGNPPPVNAPTTDTNVSTTVGGTGNSLGEMGGTLAVRDSVVPGYRDKLDEMAKNLVVAVNDQQNKGYGLDGLTGLVPPATNNFFDPAKLASGTIALDKDLNAAKIAAGASVNTGDNVNALNIAAIQRDSTQVFSTGNDSFAGFYNSLVSTVGIDTQGAQNTTAQDSAFLKQLNALRSSNSGVSLDEELTNLVKYQQAFQGAAKVINAATSMLDTILAMVQ